MRDDDDYNDDNRNFFDSNDNRRRRELTNATTTTKQQQRDRRHYRRFRHLFHVVDWFPTIAEWLNVVPRHQTRLDGVSQVDSLLSLFKDDDDDSKLKSFPAR